MLLAILTILILLLITILSWESWVHNKRIAQIPLRIHVNGTRGKSSVTRLVAGALRENGISTIAKTTGTLPRITTNDGEDWDIQRYQKPNIIEQKYFVEFAVKHRSTAIVVECMALQPEYQWISDAKLIQATHFILTNVREDHLEIMGPTEEDVALALASSVPQNGVVFLGLTNHWEIFRRACQDRNSQLVVLEKSDLDCITEEFMEHFSYREHRENVALVRKFLTYLGLDQPTSWRGMWKTEPDPGAFTISEIEYFQKSIYFANGFAANDPSSSRIVFEQACKTLPQVTRYCLIVNLREDRTDRTIQLAKNFQKWQEEYYLILVGGESDLFLSLYPSKPKNLAVFRETPTASDVFEAILAKTQTSILVVGLGNAAGFGLEMAEFFKNRQKGKLTR